MYIRNLESMMLQLYHTFFNLSSLPIPSNDILQTVTLRDVGVDKTSKTMYNFITPSRGVLIVSPLLKVSSLKGIPYLK
jgi:hypothetical protein